MEKHISFYIRIKRPFSTKKFTERTKYIKFTCNHQTLLYVKLSHIIAICDNLLCINKKVIQK